MIRQRLFGGRETGPEFRHRGDNVSRLESFSDAVFAFALTLLVVSLEVPRTFGQLLAAVRDFAGFGVCFFALFALWYRHYQFFRRYGLEDRFVAVVNAALMFVILFYVYPLKFLATLLTTLFVTNSINTRLADGTLTPMMHQSQMPLLMVLYGGGTAAVFALFGLLYAHAWRHRDALSLTPVERHDTRVSMFFNFSGALLGLSAPLMAMLMQRHQTSAGLAVMLVPVLAIRLFRVRQSRQRRQIGSEE